MTLNFIVTETDALAFMSRYFRDSKSHQAIRNRARWSVPCIFVALACYYIWRDGLELPLVRPVGFCFFGILWWFFYPRRFDHRVLSHIRKSLKESSHAKSLGTYELQLLPEHLQSTSPLGFSTFAWTAVDRVVMDSDYLYIFLVSSSGYPVRIAEIGHETAQKAHDFIAARIKPLLPPPLP